jgi:hypothetical protein
MRKQIYMWLAIIALCWVAGAQDEKRPPSTPEERKRFLTVVHKVEQTPLDENLWPEVRWALKWLEDIPDVNVTPCPAPLGSFVVDDYKYRALIFSEFTLSMGAFLIEHPEKTADNNAQYVAGVEAALRTYKAILKNKPQSKSKGLEELLDKQAQGKLVEFVRDASKECNNTNRS